jgi:hypothetical protein
VPPEAEALRRGDQGVVGQARATPPRGGEEKIFPLRLGGEDRAREARIGRFYL